jgi:hypothetical protein
MFKGTILKEKEGEIKNRRGKLEFSLMLQSITTKVRGIFFRLYKNDVAFVTASPNQSYPSCGHIKI